MKKLSLWLLIILMIFCFASCKEAGDKAESSKPSSGTPVVQDTRTISEKAHDDSIAIIEDSSFILASAEATTTYAEYLSEILKNYTKFSNKYAKTPEAWKAALDYHKYELLDVYSDVFGSSYTTTKAVDASDSASSLRVEIEKANEVGTRSINYIADIYNIYTACFDDVDVLDKLNYLLDDKIVVEEPKHVFKSSTEFDVKGFYSQIMSSKVEGNKTVYTLTYPDYYQWKKNSGETCTVSNVQSSNPGGGSQQSTTPVVDKSAITLTYGSESLSNSKEHKYSYANSWYRFNYAVTIPNGVKATVNCTIDNPNLYILSVGTTSGRLRLKYPGTYKVVVTVTPEDTTTYSTVKSTFTIKISDPLDDVKDEHLGKIKSALATTLTSMIYETVDYADILENPTVKSLILNALSDNNTTLSNLLAETDLGKLASALLNLPGLKIQLPYAVKRVSDYEDIDEQFYNVLSNSGTNDSKSVYAYHELFTPYYLNEVFNVLNDILGELCLESSETGILYKNSLLASNLVNNSSTKLDIDSLLALFTNTESAIYKMMATDMPYPLITSDTTINATEPVQIAELINLLALIDEPTSLINHTGLLDKVDLLVDCLQTPTYFEGDLYVYDSEDKTYDYKLPSLISKIASSKFITDKLDGIKIDAEYYDIKSYYDAAITDLKRAITLEATTLVQTLL